MVYTSLLESPDNRIPPGFPHWAKNMTIPSIIMAWVGTVRTENPSFCRWPYLWLRLGQCEQKILHLVAGLTCGFGWDSANRKSFILLQLLLVAWLGWDSANRKWFILPQLLHVAWVETVRTENLHRAAFFACGLGWEVRGDRIQFTMQQRLLVAWVGKCVGTEYCSPCSSVYFLACGVGWVSADSEAFFLSIMSVMERPFLA